jgi:hypothetical protein
MGVEARLSGHGGNLCFERGVLLVLVIDLGFIERNLSSAVTFRSLTLLRSVAHGGFVHRSFEGRRVGSSLACPSEIERHERIALHQPSTRSCLLVAEATAAKDTNLIVAALLHDAIEDQGVGRDEIASRFGNDVAELMEEVTDDTSLPANERKRLQVEQAPRKSHRCKILKLANKVSNVRSLTSDPPWSGKRRMNSCVPRVMVV